MISKTTLNFFTVLQIYIYLQVKGDNIKYDILIAV